MWSLAESEESGIPEESFDLPKLSENDVEGPEDPDDDDDDVEGWDEGEVDDDE